MGLIFGVLVLHFEKNEDFDVLCFIFLLCFFAAIFSRFFGIFFLLFG
jgi:hypothetical protein